MLRNITAAVILVSCFTAVGWAQTPATDPAAAPSSKPVAKKAAPKAKAATKQPVAETGPCRLGIIAAIEDRFSVQKFGLTVFETEGSAVAVNGWGFDDLAVARIRAVTGADPGVRRIAYPKGAFEPFYNPTSRFLPDPREGLSAIVKGITPTANCERYLVVTRYKTQLANTNLTLDGVGVYSRGLGSVLRRTELFANVSLSMLDGSTYERINRPLGNFGARLARGLQLGEDPLTKLENSEFPEPSAAAAGNTTLRERTRALIAARLDEVLPTYLSSD